MILFNKYHINKDWQDRFTDATMDYLSENKKLYYDLLKQAFAIEPPNGIDFIVIIDVSPVKPIVEPMNTSWLDYTPTQPEKPNNSMTYKSVLVHNGHQLYQAYDRMFFSGNLMRTAVQNLLSENKPLSEISKKIVDGEEVRLDPALKFPYTSI